MKNPIGQNRSNSPTNDKEKKILQNKGGHHTRITPDTSIVSNHPLPRSAYVWLFRNTTSPIPNQTLDKSKHLDQKNNTKKVKKNPSSSESRLCKPTLTKDSDNTNTITETKRNRNPYTQKKNKSTQLLPE